MATDWVVVPINVVSGVPSKLPCYIVEQAVASGTPLASAGVTVNTLGYGIPLSSQASVVSTDTVSGYPIALPGNLVNGNTPPLTTGRLWPR